MDRARQGNRVGYRQLNLVVDAALDVKLESEYLELKGYESAPMAVCPPEVDPALQQYAEGLFRQMILPELVNEVNTAPEYRELRTIFYSRIIAEWYKEQHALREQALFAGLIGQGDAAEWYAIVPWDKQDIFNRYVESVTQGEFNITRQTQQGNIIYTRTYFYGGVDFSDVPMSQITYTDLVAQRPLAEQQVLDSLLTPTGYWTLTEAWFGGYYGIGTSAEAPIPASAPQKPGGPCGAGAILLMLMAWVGWWRRSLRGGN